MKRNGLTFLALMVIVLLMGACNNNVWDELPSPIVKFVSEYFPFGEVSSYKVTESGSEVNIKNGATLKFNKDYEWVDVNGNGQELPQQFIYDKLPPVLFNYIQEMEADHSVYRVVRLANIIKVYLLDSDIEYDESTQTITYPSITSKSVLPF